MVQLFYLRKGTINKPAQVLCDSHCALADLCLIAPQQKRLHQPMQPFKIISRY